VQKLVPRVSGQTQEDEQQQGTPTSHLADSLEMSALVGCIEKGKSFSPQTPKCGNIAEGGRDPL